VVFSEIAELFENLDALTQKKHLSLIPKTMEEYGQNYGLILYSTVLDAFDGQRVKLRPSKYRDRANFYVDDQWFATFTRDRERIKIADGVQAVDGLPTIAQNGSKRKIDILVENIGRVNFGEAISDERKGLEDAILSSSAKLFGYETRTLPLNDLTKLEWSKKKSQDVRPCFFKGHFEAKSGIDTYVDFSKFGHGYIWINGFNLGRYDSLGPQLTLYVPGELLRERNNEIIVLDINPTGKRNCISLLNHEILEGDATDLS
jgi:beta-galactosidase